MKRYTDLVNPCFIDLSEHPETCPRCGHAMELQPSAYNPDVALWHCPECGRGWSVVAPEDQRIGDMGPVHVKNDPATLLSVAYINARDMVARHSAKK